MNGGKEMNMIVLQSGLYVCVSSSPSCALVWSNTCESFPDQGEKVITLPDSEGTQTGDSVDLHENTSIAPLDQSSSFPEAAQAFVEAIRRNRAYQKFLRKKLTEMCASCSFPCGR
ncbi:hypothetical protein F2Q70_00008399 [Brassica cretica]|uniref:Uncharacterized protein n=1 Tax=Brassica cretica TaxID=69181 RepID=A0A8S9M0T7_BRACR|nr:hypothetical protein F2Q70_00008399 [Brassica cretica]